MIKKISITYPALESEKWTACLSQNRQFQWFAWDPTFIFPVIPAYAATLLKHNGYDVFWDDWIAEKLSYEKWFERIVNEKPDLIAIETKTPTVKQIWTIIDKLKSELPNSVIVLMWDHATWFPEESFHQCKVDYVMASWDFDFALLDLVKFLNWEQEMRAWWYWKEGDEIKNSWKRNVREKEYDLNSLPFIDRELVKYKLYAYKNWNFKYEPWTYTMVWRDCWWGRCTFCSWTTYYPSGTFRMQKPEYLIEELEKNIIPMWIKEVFDDSGTFPVGPWLRKFCQLMIEKGLNKKITMWCNMRFGYLKKEDYELLAQANFRFILYGIESANQKTLDMLDKWLDITVVQQELEWAKEANKKYKGQIQPHITTMIGYPWESYEEAKNTITFCSNLFKKWLLDTLQATIVMPYPGTPLYNQAVENGWLNVPAGEWERYDMRERVLNSPLTEEQTKELVQSIYKSFISPKFIVKKLLEIRSPKDVWFLLKSWIKLFNHLLDFKK